MPDRVPIALASEIPSGEGKEYVFEGQVIAIFHVEGDFHAIDGLCPHAGGPIGNGQVRGTVVTCPWHGWQFDVTTGQHCISEQIKTTQYQLEREGDQLFLILPE